MLANCEVMAPQDYDTYHYEFYEIWLEHTLKHKLHDILSSSMIEI